MSRFMALSNPKLYRPCAGLMILNSNREVFVGKRIDSAQSGWWQMPQGGIDEGENPREAALRELEEETGIVPGKVAIVAEAPHELIYDLPDDLKGTLWGGQYIGQRQTWFLMQFLGTDTDIQLDAHNPPEFCAWQWVTPEHLPGLIIPFKTDVYRQVVDFFTDYL